MKIIESVREMQEWSLSQCASGRKISFVPTMGFLHEGHLSLMREAVNCGDVAVMSIFVNPTQFGPSEDLDRYPRDREGDIAKAKARGVEVAFIPSAPEMYPEGYQTFVTVNELSKGLCGKARPGHFRGVATVVLKLFNIVKPDVVVFGEKDYQQLQVIRRMVGDMNLRINVVGMPIVREADGLAMSSRNKYLSPEERIAALSLSRSINAALLAVKDGVRDVETLLRLVSGTIHSAKIPKIEYVEICDPQTLKPLKELSMPARLILAAFVGKTRLIDNGELK
jgi:pantoate--beta-alanine ligase